jgi:hypothetical protein
LARGRRRFTIPPMDTPPPTPAQPAPPADPRLAAWEALRDELQALHARLEYTALMLRLQNRQN